MVWLSEEQLQLFSEIFDLINLPKNRRKAIARRDLSFFTTDAKAVVSIARYLQQIKLNGLLESAQYYNALKNSGLITKDNELTETAEVMLDFLHEYDIDLVEKANYTLEDEDAFVLELIILVGVANEGAKGRDVTTARVISNLEFVRQGIVIAKLEDKAADVIGLLQYNDDTDKFLALQGISYQGYEVNKLLRSSYEIDTFTQLYMDAYKKVQAVDEKELSAEESVYYDVFRSFVDTQKDVRFRVRYALMASILLEGTVFPETLRSILSDDEIYQQILPKYVSGSKKIVNVLSKLEELYTRSVQAKNNNTEESMAFDTGTPFNRILFGAPGTGKSYRLNEEAKKLLKGNYEEAGFMERVTFHPEYTYSGFVGSYRPTVDTNSADKSITYAFVPGPFMRILGHAIQNPDVKHLLVIEEINRANVASVFGEVFQLLDRKKGISEYSIQASEEIKSYLVEKTGLPMDRFTSVRIPNNLYIWATMNSADQGVFPLDTAFKRRWDFTYLGINESEEVISDYVFNLNIKGENKKVKWNDVRKNVNDLLSETNVPEDKLMGPFFLSEEELSSQEKFESAFRDKVIMYLFDDAARQSRKHIFSGVRNSQIFSEVLKDFSEHGLDIFPSRIGEQVLSVSE